jgi:hypothetical protein
MFHFLIIPTSLAVGTRSHPRFEDLMFIHTDLLGNGNAVSLVLEVRAGNKYARSVVWAVSVNYL